MKNSTKLLLMKSTVAQFNGQISKKYAHQKTFTNFDTIKTTGFTISVI